MSEPRPETPVALAEPRRRVSIAWIIPVIAVALAGFLAYRSVSMRGVRVTVVLQEGRGIKSGDAVRYRGIDVGRVRTVELLDSLQSVRLVVNLTKQGDRIARRGARFWVVRPEIRLEGIEGLETLMGPHYLAVLPGEGRRIRQFVGLEEAPIVEEVDPDDLEVLVRTPRQGNLLPGGPVMFRGIDVGVITSVGLTSDGGAVEARLHIESRYAPLIRQNSRFWRVGGVKAELGISGVELDIDSLPTLLKGGVGIATPPQDRAGEPVRTGHRFTLAPAAQSEWLRWEPLVAVGSTLLPPGASLPRNVRAKLAWKQGRIFAGARSRQGWILPTERGVLIPLDLLEPSERAREESVVLEIAGEMVPLTEPIWTENGLALAQLELLDEIRLWSVQRIRGFEEVEDCVLCGDPNADVVPLAADRLVEKDGIWVLDDSVSVGRDWNGAAVLARSDGKLVGILVIDDDLTRVVPVPEQLLDNDEPR